MKTSDYLRVLPLYLKILFYLGIIKRVKLEGTYEYEEEMDGDSFASFGYRAWNPLTWILWFFRFLYVLWFALSDIIDETINNVIDVKIPNNK